MNGIKGHLIRWLLIIIMGTFILLGMYSHHPWSAESAIKESLLAMNMPGDVQSVSTIDVGKLKAVLFWDEEHELYHHSWMDVTLGRIWTPQGGGFGHTLDGDTYNIKFGEGYSNKSNHSYHYVLGQVNDSRVRTVEILWRDGTTETKEPALGRIIHFAREGKPGESALQSLGLKAYDYTGTLLYDLDHNNNSVPAE